MRWDRSGGEHSPRAYSSAAATPERADADVTGTRRNMCGIAGIIDHHADAPLRAQLGSMLESLIKRGPDGSGEYVEGALAMGMRRLAVIDLESGSQPLYAAD